MKALLAIAWLASACGHSELSSDAAQTKECLDNASNVYRVIIEADIPAIEEGTSFFAATEIGLARASATCLAVGETEVRDGRVEVILENRTDDAVYPLFGAFIDVDTDGVCEPGVDHIWGTWGGTGKPELPVTQTLTLDDFTADDRLNVCRMF